MTSRLEVALTNSQFNSVKLIAKTNDKKIKQINIIKGNAIEITAKFRVHH